MENTEIKNAELTVAETVEQDAADNSINLDEMTDEQKKLLKLIEEKVAEAYTEGYKTGTKELAESMKSACKQMSDSMMQIADKLDDVIKACDNNV